MRSGARVCLVAIALLAAPLAHPEDPAPRVEDILTTPISGFYMSPYEDLKLKRP